LGINLLAVGIKREDYVIVLENLDFLFTKDKVSEAVRLWKDGVPFPEMVDRLRPESRNKAFRASRDVREVEVFLLLMHLGLNEKIDCRAGSFWGGDGQWGQQ